MNILTISTDRNLFQEGSAVRARTVEYGGLANELHIVVFAKRSLELHEGKIAPNVFLYPTNVRSRWGHICGAIRVARELKKRGVKIDVVSAQDPFETGVAGYFVARLFKAGFHAQVHTDLASPYFARESVLNRVRVCLARFVLPRASAVRVVSERIKKSLSTICRKLPIVTVLPIFVSCVPRGEVLPQKKYPQFSKILLVVSRLAKEKNIMMAVSAMREVTKKYPTTGLIVVGSGSEEQALKTFVQKHHLGANILFEGWKSDPGLSYAYADALLIPSWYEGYGMTAIEALCAGVPVIMTDVGCAGEVVRNGENGIVVPVGDEGAFTRAILAFLSGEMTLSVQLPDLPTKEEYLARYKRSWEDALV